MGKGRQGCGETRSYRIEQLEGPQPEAEQLREGIRRLAERAAELHPQARLYEVGGCLRDQLLGRKPKDIDVAITGLLPEQLQALAEEEGRTEPLVVAGQMVGFRLRAPWTGAEDLELALGRTEISTGSGHDDFAIRTDPAIRIEEDLARRDFTCNALAREVRSGELVDPFDGEQDIRDGVLRVVSEQAFRDDPLRVLRGLARMAHDGSEPDPHTRQLMEDFAGAYRRLSPQQLQQAGREDLLPLHEQWQAALRQGQRAQAHQLAQQLGQQLGQLPLAPERMHAEMDKILAGPQAARALGLARDVGLLGAVMPELERLVGYDQQSRYHQLSADQHTLLVLQRACEHQAPQNVRWAALLHDSGKPAAAWVGKDGRRHFYPKPAGKAFAEPQLVQEHHLDWAASARELGRPETELRQAWRSGQLDSQQLIGRSHQELGDELATQALHRLHAPLEQLEQVRTLVAEHMFSEDDRFEERSPERQGRRARRWLARIGRQQAPDLLLLRRCDRGGKQTGPVHPDPNLVAFQAEVERQWDAPLTVRELPINGQDFLQAGIQGPRIGQLQRRFLQQVIDRPELAQRERLLEWIRRAA